MWCSEQCTWFLTISSIGIINVFLNCEITVCCDARKVSELMPLIIESFMSYGSRLMGWKEKSHLLVLASNYYIWTTKYFLNCHFLLICHSMGHIFVRSGIIIRIVCNTRIIIDKQLSILDSSSRLNIDPCRMQHKISNSLKNPLFVIYQVAVNKF